MNAAELSILLSSLDSKDVSALRLIWRNHLGGTYPKHLPRWLLIKLLAFRLQVRLHGDLDATVLRELKQHGREDALVRKRGVALDGKALTPGTMLVREWQGRPERVMVQDQGFSWNGKSWNSLSQVAKAITGTNWNGYRFFGLQRTAREKNT